MHWRAVTAGGASPALYHRDRGQEDKRTDGQRGHKRTYGAQEDRWGHKRTEGAQEDRGGIQWFWGN